MVLWDKSDYSGATWSFWDELLICGSSVRSRQGPLSNKMKKLGQSNLREIYIKENKKDTTSINTFIEVIVDNFRFY